MLDKLIEYVENHVCDEHETLLLEKSYQDAYVWEEDIDNLEKGRVAAPVGTIKVVGNAEYIKTQDGWRYHTTGHRKSVQDHLKGKGQAIPAHLTGDMGSYKKNTESTKFSVKEGSSLTAKDGTKGEVVAHDGHHATVKYQSKDGTEKTTQVDAVGLEQRVSAGHVKHQASKEASEQEKDAKHEDNDENITQAATLEKKQGEQKSKEKQLDKEKIERKLDTKFYEMLKNGKFKRLKRDEQMKLITKSEKDTKATESKLTQNFSDKETDALDSYASSNFQVINRFLRNPQSKISEGDKKIIANIDAAIKKNTLKEDIVVYRSLSGSQELKMDNAFQSTSIDPYKSSVFQREGGTIHALRIPKGTNYAYIGGGEKELLLPRGLDLSKFVVKEEDNKLKKADTYTSLGVQEHQAEFIKSLYN